MLLSNADILNKIDSLHPFLDRNDMIGYCAARNSRRLMDASLEYSKKQQEIMNLYGDNELDIDGNPTGRIVIQIGSENFHKFKAAITPYSILEHEVTIMKIPYSEVIGKLTGSEILEIDWMLEDLDSPADE